MGKRAQGILQNQSTYAFFGFESKTVFAIFLAHLVCLKSVELEMSGSFKVRSQ
jgi:hypothetical protein